jgi:hypothetical protein
MPHGTLITIYDSTAAVINQVDTILQNPPFPFELKESTFFVQIGFIGDFNTIVAALQAQGITFTAILFYDTTGDALRSGNISAADTTHLSQLLCLP